MGRGIVESGLFRSERLTLQERTSDPSTTEEGEAWIRTDLNPDTDQLATLRLDNGSGTWDVPIYDTAATTDNVSKALRVEVAGSTGFVPVTTSGGTYDALRLQHDGNTYAFHDALEAFAIPDSGVARWKYEQDVTDSWGDNDGTNNGATFTTDSKVGEYALSFDGNDDYVETPPTQPYSGSFSLSYWFKRSDGSDGMSYSKATSNDNFYARHNDTSPDIDSTPNVVIVDPALTDGLKTDNDALAAYGSYNDGAWHHVCYTRGASNGTLYIDGSSEMSASVGSINESSTRIILGGWTNGLGSFPFAGIQDDPRLYNKGLSGSEVSNLYQTGSIDG